MFNMNGIIRLFEYRIGTASNHFDCRYVVAFLFNVDFTKLYAAQSFDQEIEDGNSSYIDSGYLVYSFIKKENGLHFLKIDNSFEDIDSVREYVLSNYGELSCYDPCNNKMIEKWVKLVK